jgi:hypothetical protein
MNLFYLQQNEQRSHEYPVRGLVAIPTELRTSQRIDIDYGFLSFGSNSCKLKEQRLFKQDCEGTHRKLNKRVQQKGLRIPPPLGHNRVCAAPPFHLRMGTDPFPERVIFGIQKDGKFQKRSDPKFNIP